MTGNEEALGKIISSSLSGKGAHVATGTLLTGLGWKAAGARPEGAPHSIFQILNHIVYWQEWGTKWLDGESPAVPTHASGSWPGDVAPSDAKEWQQAVRAFRNGLAKLKRRSHEAGLLALRGKHKKMGSLQAIASHNSYHAGQIVLLRQMLGAWPPPSAGLTW